MKPMTRILIGLEGYIMALISTRADGELKQSGDVIGEGSVIYRNFTDGKYDGYSMGEMMVLYDSVKDQVIISVSDYVPIFERIS